jgi:hypothetical protein
MSWTSPLRAPPPRRRRRYVPLPLLLWLCAACDLGASSRRILQLDAGSPRVDARVPREPAPDLGDEDSDYLFDPDVLRTFELRLHEDDLAFLDADPKAEEYVPGEMVFEGKRVAPVGIRYKGSTGSFVGCLSGGFPPTGKKTCPKLGMKIKIDYGDPEAKFYGQKKLLFHAMNSDRSLMRERLGYGLYRELGVHAARAVHVQLLINGQFSGLYLLVEEIDGRFTRSRFADGGHGNLYKEAWPTLPDPALYLPALETNRDEDPVTDKMVAFARALHDADDESLPGVVEQWMDSDYAARFVAVDRTIRHDDGPYHWYCQTPNASSAAWHNQRPFGSSVCGNHNFFWYEDTGADRLWPVPWDLDNAMPNMLGFTTVQARWDDLSQSCERTIAGAFGQQMPATCDPLQRAWALGLRTKIRAAMQELTEGPMSEAAVSEKLGRWAQQIEPVVERASALYPREPTLEGWQRELELLQGTLERLRVEALPPDESASDAEADGAR